MGKQLASFRRGIAQLSTGQLEGAGGAQQAGVEKLEERPQLVQVILDRRSAQRQMVIPHQQTNRFVRLGVGVLDGLRFAQYDVIENHVLEVRGIAA